jgi:hypothetical protein
MLLVRSAYIKLVRVTKKSTAADKIVIGDEEYRWRFRHGGVVVRGVGLKGFSVSVWRKPDRTRELILDFPFSQLGENRSPVGKALLAVLPTAIQAAIDAGWDPDSRGRTFRFNMPAAVEDPQEYIFLRSVQSVKIRG